MIQGGGMESGLVKTNPFTDQNEANNGLSNKIGTIAMAYHGTAFSQLTVFHQRKQQYLPDFRLESLDGWGYCVFGEVVEGMDVVNKIKGVSTGSRHASRCTTRRSGYHWHHYSRVIARGISTRRVDGEAMPPLFL